MSKGFSITSIKNYHGAVLITTDPSGKETISFQTKDKNGNLVKTNCKEKIYKILKEGGCTDEQIKGVFENMVKEPYKIAPYPGIDTIEIENSRKSEIEHWPGDNGEGEYFKHRLDIDSYDMVFAFRILDKKVLLEYCLMEDARIGYTASMDWATTKPFKFIDPSGCLILMQYIPFKNWVEYFSLEPIKNYVLKHGAHENFLTEKGMFY